MPLRDYVQNVRDIFHREPESAFSGSSVAARPLDDKCASPGPLWTPRGDLPSDKLFIPDECLATLASTVRPRDKIRGVLTALNGALGAPGGYSVVKAALFANVRLVQT